LAVTPTEIPFSWNTKFNNIGKEGIMGKGASGQIFTNGLFSILLISNTIDVLGKMIIIK